MEMPVMARISRTRKSPNPVFLPKPFSKIFCFSSRGIPAPLSSTVIISVSAAFSHETWISDTVSPWRTALSIRLEKTLLIIGSAKISVVPQVQVTEGPLAGRAECTRRSIRNHEGAFTPRSWYVRMNSTCFWITDTALSILVIKSPTAGSGFLSTAICAYPRTTVNWFAISCRVMLVSRLSFRFASRIAFSACLRGVISKRTPEYISSLSWTTAVEVAWNHIRVPSGRMNRPSKYQSLPVLTAAPTESRNFCRSSAWTWEENHPRKSVVVWSYPKIFSPAWTFTYGNSMLPPGFMCARYTTPGTVAVISSICSWRRRISSSAFLREEMSIPTPVKYFAADIESDCGEIVGDLCPVLCGQLRLGIREPLLVCFFYPHADERRALL